MPEQSFVKAVMARLDQILAVQKAIVATQQRHSEVLRLLIPKSDLPDARRLKVARGILERVEPGVTLPSLQIVEPRQGARSGDRRG